MSKERERERKDFLKNIIELSKAELEELKANNSSDEHLIAQIEGDLDMYANELHSLEKRIADV